MSTESWKAGLCDALLVDNCYASCGKCLHCRASALGYKRAKAEDREERPISRHTAEKIIDLAQLCLRFGRVNRITYHEDGKRFESDTDHTVMLAVVACAFATQYAPYLDVGRLDLPEARFIKVLDKVLPKITHILNHGAALREHGVHAGNIDAVNNSQADKMRASYAADQPAVMALYAEVHAILKETLLAWPAQYVEINNNNKERA